MAALEPLLRTLTESELRGLVRTLGDQASDHLPEPPISRAELSYRASELIVRHDALDAELLQRLLLLRPNLRPRITDLARAIGVAIDPAITARASAPAPRVGPWTGLIGLGCASVLGGGLMASFPGPVRPTEGPPAPVTATYEQAVLPPPPSQSPPAAAPLQLEPTTAVVADDHRRGSIAARRRSIAGTPRPTPIPAPQPSRWTVERVTSVRGDDQKRIVLTGPLLPPNGLLYLHSPVSDERSFSYPIECRIEHGSPQWCMAIVRPGNPGFRPGDTLTIKPQGG